jgi:hypothetical protein
MKANLIKRPKKQKTLETRKLEVSELPETGEMKIQAPAIKDGPAKEIRFPAKTKDQYKLPPEEFVQVQNAIEAFNSRIGKYLYLPIRSKVVLDTIR